MPPSPNKKRAQSNEEPLDDLAKVIVAEEEPLDSVPINFDTYVPTHDPSLISTMPPHPPAVPGPDYSQFYLPSPPGPTVSQDEAFSRALSAMYWGGYWTAVYHVSMSLFIHSGRRTYWITVSAKYSRTRRPTECSEE